MATLETHHTHTPQFVSLPPVPSQPCDLWTALQSDKIFAYADFRDKETNSSAGGAGEWEGTRMIPLEVEFSKNRNHPKETVSVKQTP